MATREEKDRRAYEEEYWMDKEEEKLWAQDQICFQHLVLNEMKRSNNTDNWVAGMVGTELEVARTIDRSMDATKWGYRDRNKHKGKRGLAPAFHTDVSKSSKLYTRHIGKKMHRAKGANTRYGKGENQQG
jgi:hypothetical protein